MYFNCSEKVKMLENDEKWKICFACKLVLKLHILFVYCMGAFDFWPLPIFACLCWLLWETCICCWFLYAVYIFWNMQFFDKKKLCIFEICSWLFNYAVLKTKKMNLCIFKFVHSFLKIKFVPFCEPGEIPRFAKRVKLIPAVCF